MRILELNHILEELRSALCHIFGNKLNHIWLYGSYARGDNDEESDLDILALVDLSKNELAAYRREVSDLSSELDLQYGVLLSIKLQDTETFHRYSDSLPFFQNVIKEGISIV
ncbi:nucleotidyltransferase domain-containing protein [Anaerovoracaceae bacterium 41-7]|uniref:nucleotidyltransferase family protein n=1 Tax=Clostridia TaxID=186801 RepID=UPI00136341D2|nr:nucleotidyltransferase domain-containing protein [Senimuribacter intestinalis]